MMNASVSLSRHYGLNAYQNATQGLAPAKMVALGFDGLAEYLRRAKQAFEAGDAVTRAHCLDRAFRILEHLAGALDMEVGGEVAENLQMLYNYLMERIGRANIFDQPELLTDCQSVVEDLQSAWNEVASAETGSNGF